MSTNFIELDDGSVRLLSPTDEAWEAQKQTEWAKVVPRRFADATIADVAPDVAGELTTWSGDRNVLITGPVGSGKTHLALALARRLFWAGKRVRFAPVVEALDNLRPGAREFQRTDEHRPEAWVDVYSSVDLLVLDDLGGEKPTDWTAERLYLLVNRRWLDERPTIATTNLKPDELKQWLGERTYDRLRDGAVGLVVSGESHRGRR